MSTYLKNMVGYKQSQLENKSFADIQKLFDKAMTRVNIFFDMDTELVEKSSKMAKAEESSSKRSGDELEPKKIFQVVNAACTPKRRNRTLIEAARTMLADSKLPTTFWAKAVNTACYVHNRVLVVKPHNKTPYELFRGRTPALSFMRPFGCHVTILNTLDYLGKFDGKLNEGFFVGYSLNSKAFRVYNIRTSKVEESLHIRFLEDKPVSLKILSRTMEVRS
ncbi:retrovirus-related pol polyprotein from transposon TNT 1-94 [Tanacetum coccineum]